MRLSLQLTPLLALLLGDSLVLCSPDWESWKVGQTVKTTSGSIRGHAASSLTEVSEYLGIPYAQPPVGPLRFKKPKKFTGNGIVDGTKFAPDCPANVAPKSIAESGIKNLAGSQSVKIIDNIQQLGKKVSEDCLCLNIWTQPQFGEMKKAVMVWIHGGGFQGGTTNTFLYNGQVLAGLADVVVVSINYRINVFGFPGLPGSGLSQNPALLDQRLAIEWVRDNIGAFGGDPKRITLFGQSAGGAAIDMYSYAYMADPIVHGLISESGVATSFVNPTPANNTAAWYKVATEVGCGNASTPLHTTISCMQGKNFTDILAAEAGAMVQFNPSVDSVTVFSDYDTRTRQGKFAKVPVLLGNNDYEAGIIKVIYQQRGINQTLEQWSLLNQITFTCPVGHRANEKADQVPVWRYRYYGEFENTRLTFNPSSGAWHGGEIAIVFGSAGATGVQNTLAETGIMAYMMDAWTSFAKDPTSGLHRSPFRWPTYHQNSASLIRLGYANKTTASYIYPVTYDYACDAVLTPGGPNMTAIRNIANFTQLGGGSEIGY